MVERASKPEQITGTRAITGCWHGTIAEMPTQSRRSLEAEPQQCRREETAIAKRADPGITVPESAADLLARVEAEGGELRIPNPLPAARARWRQAIHALITGSDLPTGKCVRHSGRDKGDLVIRVVDVDQWPPAPAKPDPIPIPDNLRGCHPMIRATRENASATREAWVRTGNTPGIVHLDVHRSSLQRALLIMQGIANEAERRGYKVAEHQPCGGDRGFAVVIGQDSFEITVREATRRAAHVLSPAEERQKARGGYFNAPLWNYQPSGNLNLQEGHGSYRPALATDRQRWRLEDRLPRVFAVLEEKAAEAETRRVAEARRIRDEAAAWKAAQRQARKRLVQQHRVEWLTRQLNSMRRAEEARRFAAAARALDLPAADSKWVDWVEAYAERIDPLSKPLAPPPPPQPTDENLRPFLDGVRRCR